MPSHGGHTTRRARFIWLRNKYLALREKQYWRYWSTDFKPGSLEDRVRVFRWPNGTTGPVVRQRLKTSNTYNATPFFPQLLFYPYTVSVAAPLNPPHVSVGGIQPSWHALNMHARKAKAGYHLRGVKSRRKPQRKKRCTAFNRRVTGCNWHYFRQGYFPDDDPLGRHPNMTDFENGVPPGTTQWPVPLGYQ